jgi:hypothetical protein
MGFIGSISRYFTSKIRKLARSAVGKRKKEQPPHPHPHPREVLVKHVIYLSSTIRR